MIGENHSQLSLVRQCELVSIARSSYYHRPKTESEFNLELMRVIDEQYLKTPWYGSPADEPPFAASGPLGEP